MTEPGAGHVVSSSRGNKRSRRTLIALLIVAALMAGASVTVGALYFAGAFSTEVVAEPLGDPGSNPFAPPLGEDRPVPAPPANSGVLVSGDTVGLYGGTLNQSACDPDKLVRFLQSNPDKASAWAGILGISAAEISVYVRGLTPLILRSDTAVTNHGFANGKATTLNSILQAGTAVLVDKNGVPRVRCSCGNPLTPAKTYSRPAYIGKPWQGFHPELITTIRPSVTVINEFTIINLGNNRTIIRRPVGTRGNLDIGRLEEAAITGTHVFKRELQDCSYVKGCHLAGAVLNVRFDCSSVDACTAILLGGWTPTPQPLIHEGATYRFTADDPLAARCDNGPSPGTSIELVVTVTSAGIVDGTWRATAMQGTYRAASQSYSDCKAGGLVDAISFSV